MNKAPLRWVCRDREFRLSDRPLLMGIVNCTPDSFSDGGRYRERGAAVEHGRRLAAEGADIVDVGGESTRPGAADVPLEEELERVVPVVRELAAAGDAVVSVDTRKAAVARRALEAGAKIINDVSALTHDPEMAEVAREFGAAVVLMHMRGSPSTMQEDPRYEDVVATVRDYLAERVDAAEQAGVNRDALAVDPGIGFGKTLEHNLRLIAHLDSVGACGRPVVVGLSRKRFLGALTGRAVEDRLAGSLAALTFCILRGAHVMRVHDVKESRDALRVAAALKGIDGVLE